MAKLNFLLNKLTYVGMYILHISKIFVSEFHYNHIKSTYGNLDVLLITDTDSLVYWIENNDLYGDMYHHLDLYDTNEYPNEYTLLTVQSTKSC